MATSVSAGSSLLRYLGVRFLLIFPTIFILVTMVFIVMRLVGDPITASQGGKLSSEQLQLLIEEAGYNRPIFVQYFEYIFSVFTGDFGTTITDNQPVAELLVTYGIATLELVIYSLIVAFIVGFPLGMIAARKRDTAGDAGLRLFAILSYATPVFFVGLLLKLVFSVTFPIFPVAGRVGVRSQIELTAMENPTGFYLIDSIRLGNPDITADVLMHAVLPATALGLLTAGVFLRLVRTNMISTLGADYIDAARSRGVSETSLLTKNAFRPALIPIITVVGMQIALLLSGAVLTETTFEWKGLGFQLAEYLSARDYVAVQGIVALLAIIVALTNFFVDILVALVDPRVKF
jgi:peptide/nickel transport system permease protein